MPVTGAVVAPTVLATVNDVAVAPVTTALVKSKVFREVAPAARPLTVTTSPTWKVFAAV